MMARTQARVPANPHRTGHYAGLHPEDQPYHSDDLEEDESYYPARQPSSAIRYTAPVHYGPPPAIPKRRSRQYTTVEPDAVQVKRRTHWLTYVGLPFLVALLGWLAISMLAVWWQGKQDDWTYGNPKTFQVDAVVGHSDSTSNPSHFVAMNLHGEIVVIELPGGNIGKARSYAITTLPGANSYLPVRVSFKDISGHGKLDMLIDIGDPGSVVQIVLFNTGSQFVVRW